MSKSRTQSSAGFSLVEMLAAVIILALFAIALSVGIRAAVKVNYDATTDPEVQTLTSTINDLITNELRYANNIKLTKDASGEEVLASYDSSRYGTEKSFAVVDGQLVLLDAAVAEGAPGGGAGGAGSPADPGFVAPDDTVWLLPSAAYGKSDGAVSSYEVNNLKISYDRSTKTFTVTLGVKDSARSTEEGAHADKTFNVRALSGPS